MPYVFLFVVSSCFLVPTVAYAYLGPGAGAGAVTAALAMIVAILAALFGIIWFPLKRLIKKTRESKSKKIEETDEND